MNTVTYAGSPLYSLRRIWSFLIISHFLWERMELVNQRFWKPLLLPMALIRNVATCDYLETESYQVTEMFINNREYFLKRLLEDSQ